MSTQPQNPNFKVISYGTDEWKLAVNLRENILRAPQGEKFSEDELLEERDHFQIAGFLNTEMVATAVLVPETGSMKMQRVAVGDGNRSLGIGTQMMHFCEEVAKRNNVYALYCHARDSAVNFYLKNGYSKEGDYFDEDGIPHLKMVKSLI